MRTRDLAQRYITVSQDTSAVEALRALVEHGLPGYSWSLPAGGRTRPCPPARWAGHCCPAMSRRIPFSAK